MTHTAFADDTHLATGELNFVSRKAVEAQARGALRVIVLDDETGAQVDFPPLHAPPAPEPKPGRGRPRLGVVAREVTLLPRHWDWLSVQPGGASAALRRLVDDARKTHAPADLARARQTALYRAMTTLAGDRPGYEEALRALYSGDDRRFDILIAAWPLDIRTYLARLAEAERASRST